MQNGIKIRSLMSDLLFTLKLWSILEVANDHYQTLPIKFVLGNKLFRQNCLYLHTAITSFRSPISESLSMATITIIIAKKFTFHFRFNGPLRCRLVNKTDVKSTNRRWETYFWAPLIQNECWLPKFVHCSTCIAKRADSNCHVDDHWRQTYFASVWAQRSSVHTSSTTSTWWLVVSFQD